MNRQPTSNSQAKSFALPHAPSQTLAELGYTQIKKQIIDAALEPGSPLRLERLKNSLGIGYTPLREALMRLSSEGFVNIEGQRGFRVTPIAMHTLKDITDARVAIEGLALTRALEVGTDEWEAKIVANFHRLSRRPAIDPATGLISAEWDTIHRNFHHSLIDGCDNLWLKNFWEILFDQAYRYRQIAVTRGYAYRDDLVEHQRLMDTALSRDLPGALTASKDHIENTYNVVLKILAESES